MAACAICSDRPATAWRTGRGGCWPRHVIRDFRTASQSVLWAELNSAGHETARHLPAILLLDYGVLRLCRRQSRRSDRQQAWRPVRTLVEGVLDPRGDPEAVHVSRVRCPPKRGGEVSAGVLPLCLVTQESQVGRSVPALANVAFVVADQEKSGTVATARRDSKAAAVTWGYAGMRKSSRQSEPQRSRGRCAKPSRCAHHRYGSDGSTPGGL